MTTKQPLSDILAKLRESTARWFAEPNDSMVKRLIDAHVTDNALKAGDRVPEFMLPNAEGRLVQSGEVFGTRPVVLSFYRGVWCPYCSAELNALADVAPELVASGADVVAITPETGGVALKTKRERDLPFEILCDVDNGVAMEFGLVYVVPEDVRPAYERAKVRIPEYYGNDSWMLPIAATYVIDRNGIAAHAYVNADYRHRFDPANLVPIVKSLT